MARIPVYQREQSMAAPMNVARATSAVSPNSPVAAALGNLAQTGNQVVAMMGREQAIEAREAEQKQENIAAVQVANTLSEADVYWQQNSTERFKAYTTEQGDMRPAIGEDFDKWAAAQAEKLPTEKSRQYFLTHAARMKSNLQTGAYKFQEQAVTNKLNADSAAGEQADENAVFNDPTKYGDVLKRRMEPMLARTDLSEAEKIKAADLYKRKLNLAVERGEMERDPAGWYKRRFGSFNPNGVPQTVAANGSVPDALWQAQIGQESGGKQFGADGKPLTSSAGAIGVAQVMPGTAREAAGYAGLPYDEQKYKTDPAYNEALGKAYMAKQLQTFGGDVKKALAAYNMGPGSAKDGTGVRGLVETWGEDWLKHAPAETRDYVAKITTRAGMANGVKVASNGNVPIGTGQQAEAPTPPASFTGMDWEQQSALKAHAETKLRQVGAQLQTEMDARLRDEYAMHVDGKVAPTEIPPEQFAAAYGAEGVRKYADYQASRAMGADIGSYRAMPPDQIAAEVAKGKAEVDALAESGGEGYAQADARQNQRVQAAKQVVAEQQDDPQAYAAKVGLSKAQPLDMSDMEKFGQEIGGRVATAQMMRDRYAAPYTIMTKAEAAQMTQVMAKFPAEARIEYLNTIRANVSDPVAYRAVLQQIAPDSPVTAVAGSILAEPRTLTYGKGMLFGDGTTLTPKTVATTILQGEAILNPSKDAKAADGRGGAFPMPENSKMQAEFATFVGAAFRADPAGYGAAYEAYRAYYAGKASNAGVLTPIIDDKISKEALHAVTGGVIDFNGNGQVLKPWGMDDETFIATMGQRFKAALPSLPTSATNKDAVGLDGSPLVTPRMATISAYGLQNFKQNQYLLTSGRDYLRGPNGVPLVLDVRPPASLSDQIPGVAPRVTAPGAAR